MTAVRLAWLELRRFRGRPLRHAALAVIVLFPLLYGALYLWSNWDPYGKSDQVPVAVVDEDEGAEYDGGTLHAGREFVEQLKTSPMLDWNFVDAEQAEAGMADGDYYFAIVVPSDFSQKLATLAGADPERAHLLVELDDANGYIAGIMAKTMELELQNQINTAVYTTFAKSMFSDLGALHDGLNDAADAASSLEDGAEQTDESLAELVAALEALDSGAGDVAEGTEELDGKVRDIADFVGSASGTADGALADLKTDIDEASENCRGDNCEEMRELADTAAEVIPLLQGDIATADRIVQEDASDVQDLADGARAVSDGTGEVRDGASQLSDGASELTDGSAQLASSLDDAAAQTPSSDPADNAAAADALGSPVSIEETNANPAGVYGRGLAPFFFAIALWVFGMVAYLLLRTVNPRALAGKVSALNVALGGWLPAAGLGAAGAVVLYVVADLGLGLNPQNALGTIGLCALGVAAFTALAHLLRVAFGAAGGVLILVLLMLQLTSAGGLYPMETAPAFFRALHPIMPMTYFVDGMRATISGGYSARLWLDVAVLAAFAVGAVAASTVLIMRQRQWTMTRLRPGVSL